ncbi:hypothetical protein U9M48_011488 [Paspalum notatum var. saurae]|uniref:F-box domain-containing protein n=1 Tax=Paspalum notatum var. saurae TaxID=547442 RepID=A0AAQ3SVK5_PASNO
MSAAVPIIYILLRLPSGDPACLVRASLVCKPWRRLLSDRAFLRRYRAFHRTPPMLGFFNQHLDMVRGFVPTTQVSLPVPLPPPAGCTLDCRHGRVLLYTWKDLSRLTVWDPITGDQQSFCSPLDPDRCFAAAVLCASDGCDHLKCSGGPFLVVIAGIWKGPGDRGVPLSSVYSSETGAWSAPTTFDLTCYIDRITPSLLAVDALYFTVQFGVAILRHDLVRGVPSVISMPPIDQKDMCLVMADDGGLGVAAVEGYSLHLWSWRANSDGPREWVHDKAIELDGMISDVGAGVPLTSARIGAPLTWLHIIGFAECTGTVFISTNGGANDAVFSVELKSGQINKICKKKCVLAAIFPFMSFYTPGTSIIPLNIIPRFVICQYLLFCKCIGS